MTTKQPAGNDPEVPEVPNAPELPGELFAWPAMMAAAATEVIAASLDQFARLVPGCDEETVADHAPVWATRHDLRLELGTMELRDFSVRNAGVPALLKKVEEETVLSWLWRSVADEAALKGCASEQCKIVFRTGPKECGAIAMNDDGKIWGGAKRPTRDAAELAAMNNCQKRTGGQCKVRANECNK